MNEDNRRIGDRAVTSVSAQQHQQQDGLITTTRLTPFSIDNILGRSRDLAPANQPPVLNNNLPPGGPTGSSRLTESGREDTTKVAPTTSGHVTTNVTSSAGETTPSSNLEELQSLLDSRLRHQHHHQAPHPPPPHHHHHYQHSSQLSQQPTGAMPASFYAQFHRHLSILPSSIDGQSLLHTII